MIEVTLQVNTTGVDPLKERLTTTTIESSWFDRQSPATCVPVFSDGGSIRVAFDLRVPRAFKLNETFNGCAVYISLSVYLKSLDVLSVKRLGIISVSMTAPHKLRSLNI